MQYRILQSNESEPIMSNISNRHNVVAFISGKSEALTGQRLTIAKYKSTAKTPAKFPNVCASIPLLEVTENVLTENPGLLGHVTEWLLSKQDDVFKSVYESHGGTLSSIGDNELDISSIIGYLNAESVSGRLTKESIESWYALECKGIIYVNAAIKKGFIGADADDLEVITENQRTHLELVCNSYRDLFSGLAGGTTKYAPPVQESLNKMLSQCADSPMVERLVGRLESMAVAKDFADLL